MSDVYQFSQSSLELVRVCLGAANQPGTKWIELFRHKTRETAVKTENISFSDQDTILEQCETSIELNTDGQNEQRMKDIKNDQVERIVAILEAEPSKKIEYLMEQCSVNNNVLPELVDRLSSGCIETICEELLNNQLLHEDMLNIFIGAYVKKETSSNTLNLLLRAYKTNQATILAVTESLFLDMDVPSKLLEEFFKAIDKSASSQFLRTISSRQIQTELFVQRINLFNQLYKSSEKTKEIQSFLLKELLKSCQLCRADKTYGRFLLTFFERLEVSDNISKQDLEMLIASHQTPYKRLSQSILNKLYKDGP